MSPPTTRMADPRDMTMDHADEALRMIFLARLGILRREAAAEKQIDEIRQQLALDTSAQRTILAAQEACLTGYILGHREEFARPRMRKTLWGSFGLRSSTRTVIDDEAALIEAALSDGLSDIVQTVHKVHLPSLSKRLKAGQHIPGACLEPGEAAEYKLDTAALEAEL